MTPRESKEGHRAPLAAAGGGWLGSERTMRNYKPTEHWKARRRGGLPSMTKRMMLILQYLRDAQAAGFRFAELKHVRKRTINSLFERDWIFISPGLDGVRYAITGRGLKALKVYERPTRHFDGICPRCHERPRKVSADGVLYPYCDTCNKRANNRQYALKGHQYKPDGVCARCKKNPRMIYESGFVIAYCESCRREMRKEERERKHARRLELARQGKPPSCMVKGCDHPIYYTEKTTYDYCHKHYREQQNNWNRRQKEAA